jgi:hypothetical protein
MSDYYKVTYNELDSLVKNGIITRENKDEILTASLSRTPGLFANKGIVTVSLNKAKTIFLSSIRFYGGENFGEPYFFVAEIYHKTTQSAFSRFWHTYLSGRVKYRIFAY